MNHRSTPFTQLPPEQQAIRAKCFHPSGAIVEFSKEDVETSIPQRFEKIVRLYPEQIAVKTGSQVVTYAELNVMANRLARVLLTELGNKSEAIALLLSKDASLMAAMLGVLKAGKFFILLDSLFPKTRNVALLEDSQAGLVITDCQYASWTREFIAGSRRVLEVNSIELSIFADNLDLGISPEALATILYTSGSTGEPKGLICNHRDLLHRVMLRGIENQVCEHDHIALLPTGTANAVTNSLFALLNGATLCPFDTHKEGVFRLVKWLSEEGITLCPFSSSLFRSFAAVLTEKETFSALRIVRLRSETVHKNDIDLYKKFFPDHCGLVTGLSTSETGQLTTYFLNDHIDIPGDGVPIGYPVQDKEILLLDDAGNEVGVNQVGEIVVRSRYLAVGYWRRPELSEAKFKADPNENGQRLCFTGDLGVRLPDGCLVHKGRKDFRIKIRGYGVELAEVERCLLEHSAIKEAVVVTRQTGSGDTHLVAYYTARGHLPPPVDELRSFLRDKIPRYMMPLAYVFLDVMPLTPNGKVDRRALPDPDSVRPELATPYLSPRNEIEQKLIAIWEDVLDVRPVGVNDGFFDLGGDSLSATRVISQVIKHFQLEIPLQSLFQSPTIAEMAWVVAQQEGKLPKNNKQDHVAGSPLIPASRGGLLPLSYPQQRLWFLDQLDPGSFTSNLLFAYQLNGELNVAALEQSFNVIIRRHEILRTVFKSADGSPQQVVLPTVAIRIPVLDLRVTVSEEDRWTEVRRLAKEEAQRPFDLTTGPLLRITLLRLADDEYVFLQAMHHIVSDGWSGGVLFRELAALYEAFLNGQPSPLADLPTQYADYAVWQREWLRGEILESQLSYWRKQLEHITMLRLPTDRPKPAVQRSRGARQYFTLSDALLSELKSLSRRQDVTVFMTLLAAFQTLLYRFSGQTDIVLGSSVAGRSRREFEDLIGFFLNTLVLRLDLSGNPTFAETIRRVREMCLGALSHQELPFEKLVEELQPERVLSQNPLFQVSFAFQNTPRFSPILSTIKADELEIETGIARFDLHLFMEERDGHLKGYCDYDTNLFNAETIERLLSHFQTLLEGIVADPDQRISELPILIEAEKRQLLVEWNATQKDYPKDKCIHELFEGQVERCPDSIAVVFEDQQLTYRGLNTRANQLAHYLRKLGVGPETLVGICVERSIDMIVGLLGILKAGGAYVPLDPSYPKERLAFMLEDTQAAVLLTQSKTVSQLPKMTEDGRPMTANNDQYRSTVIGPQARMVCLDTDWEQVAKESSETLPRVTTAESLAYVIYTSGSTGQPKGVTVTHRGVLRLLIGIDYVQLDAKQTFLHLAPPSFDASTFEIWGALLHGANCVIFPGKVPIPSELGNMLRRYQVSTLWLTASLFNTVIDEAPEALAGVHQLLIGGEALSVPHVQRALAHLPTTQIINGYGPTESTTFTCCYRIPARLDEGISSIPIGRPIANTEVYLLDSHLSPVPIGVPGGLYIGGDGLARGYYNRPELTAEKFIPSPFREKPGAKLYSTGDLARYLADGNIEFLGRIDNQVKIRGYRIELGEIETVLAQHPAIQQTVVLAREDTPGDRRLVAYIVATAGSNPSGHDLRSYLQQKLPDYMVPSAFVFLDSLPLTPNGKLDRKALPAPDQSRPELEASFAAPRTPVEEILANIWCTVLKLDKVAIHDNFFHLGGHSLLATQVVSRIRDVFSIELPLRYIFEAPTIFAFAQRIGTHEIKNKASQQTSIARVARDNYRAKKTTKTSG